MTSMGILVTVAAALVSVGIDTPITDRQAAVAKEMTSWKSIELRVIYNQHFHMSIKPGRPATRVEHHYIETADGRRFFDTRIPVSAGVSRQTGFSDGKRFARVGYHVDPDAKTQSEINYASGFLGEQRDGYAQRPHPLQLLYVGLRPLYEALPDGMPAGSGEVLGRRTANFVFTVKSPRTTQELLYYLDDQSSMPLRIEAYADSEARAQSLPSWRWEAKSFDELNGYHMPRKSTDTTYAKRDGKATADPQLTIEANVEELRFNQEYSVSQFWPDEQPGAHVIDAVKGQIYNVPGGEVDAKGEDTPPIRANEPPNDWSVMLVPLLIIGGLATISGGIALWWRQRGS